MQSARGDGNGRPHPPLRGNPFLFFSPRTTRAEQMIGHIVREHRRGRPLEEILSDPYLVLHMTPRQRACLLEEPGLLRRLAEDYAAGLDA